MKPQMHADKMGLFQSAFICVDLRFLLEDWTLIDLHGVNRFYGGHHALKDVTLHLEPGRVGLLGPNGAGKSTLLKILMGLLPPSSGTGHVLGHDLTGDGKALRRSIGYMSEADAL